MEQKYEVIKLAIGKMRLSPGDVVVIKIKGKNPAPAEAAENITRAVRDIVKPNGVLVFSESECELSVMAKEDASTHSGKVWSGSGG